MKFTLSWLKTHLETDATLDQITDTLTRIGLELESVEDRGAALAPFRIARVVEAVPHPNADRLRVCTVDTGSDTVRVVCGAPNARTGMKGVFAPPGTFIPGTGITLRWARSAACAAPACCCPSARWVLAMTTPASSTCRRMHPSACRMRDGPASTIR